MPANKKQNGGKKQSQPKSQQAKNSQSSSKSSATASKKVSKVSVAAVQENKKVASQANKQKNPLFVARKKNFAIGHDLLPKRDLSHCVKFPRYVILQRRLKTIKNRLQEPAQIYQFQQVVDVSFSEF